mmetsp:Transcript_66253/g.174394  ORF Transcript_66253/g.174394 Transcript_66253/m.174394 type:complete len:200 (+) Transcript_66253:450-1049(+)
MSLTLRLRAGAHIRGRLPTRPQHLAGALHAGSQDDHQQHQAEEADAEARKGKDGQGRQHRDLCFPIGALQELAPFQSDREINLCIVFARLTRAGRHDGGGDDGHALAWNWGSHIFVGALRLLRLLLMLMLLLLVLRLRPETGRGARGAGLAVPDVQRVARLAVLLNFGGVRLRMERSPRVRHRHRHASFENARSCGGNC